MDADAFRRTNAERAAPAMYDALCRTLDALAELPGSCTDDRDTALIEATGNTDHAGLFAAVLAAIAAAEGKGAPDAP